MRHHLKRLLKGSVIYGLGSVATQALSLLILPLFTAYLSPEDYGINAVLSLMNALLVAVLSLGLGVSIGLVYYEPSQGQDHQGQVIWNSLLALLPGCVLLLLAAVWAPAWISRLLLHSPAHAGLVSLMLIATVLNLVSLPLGLHLQFQERSKYYVGVTLAYSFFTLAMSVLLIVGFRLGLYGRVLAYALGSLLNVLLLLRSAARSLCFRFDREMVHTLLRHGLPTIPSFFSIFVFQQGNVYILKELSSLREVGLYSVGMTFGSAASLAVNAFTTAWIPFALSFRDKPEEARHLFGRIMSYYLLSVGSLSLLFYLFAKLMVAMFTQPDFHAASRVIGLGSSVQLLLGVVTILNIESYQAKEIKYLVLCQMLAALGFVPLSILLTSRFDSVGAAAALVTGYGLLGLLLAYLNRRRRHKYLNIVYEKGRLLRFGLAYLLIAGTSLASGPEFAWWQVGLSALLLLVYGVYVYRMLLSPAERSYVEAQLRALRLRLNPGR